MYKRGEKNKIMSRYLFRMYYTQIISLALNVFVFKGLPVNIDLNFLNRSLLENGSIAFFIDEVMGLMALPYTVIGTLDIYGRPRNIEVYGINNSFHRTLVEGEFVIMYDNTMYEPILYHLRQYAQILARIRMTGLINLNQQRTPRIIKGNENNMNSLKNMLRKVEEYSEAIYTYKGVSVDDIDSILTPAPYIIDKLDNHFNVIWGEVMRFIGITSIVENKKERLITDEILLSQGGNIASRCNRYSTRVEAIERIKSILGYEGISCTYYSDTLNESDIGGVEDDI